MFGGFKPLFPVALVSTPSLYVKNLPMNVQVTSLKDGRPKRLLSMSGKNQLPAIIILPCFINHEMCINNCKIK